MASLLVGCATTISFESQPTGAEIHARRLGSDTQPQVVGQTPLQMKTSDFEKLFSAPGPSEIEFRKDGHQPSKIVMTQTINSDITLSMQLSPSNGLDDIDQLNARIDQAFEIQRLARAGKFDEALAKIKTIQKEAPQLSVSYEIEGGIYYLQKKYKQAFDSFTQAAKYNPRNVQAIRMRQKMRAPASVEQPQKKKEPKR